MRIDILTLFPEMFESPLNYSILKRAQEQGIVAIALTNIRDFTTDKYRKVDDKPYGGGPGMVMMPGPLFDCFEHVEKLAPHRGRVILLTPQGQRFDQAKARELAGEDRADPDRRPLRGVRRAHPDRPERRANLHRRLRPQRRRIGRDGDHRRGGPAAAGGARRRGLRQGRFLLRANVIRLLEYPQYTRPEVFRGMKVPEILLSGDHAKIAQWRRQQALERTRQWRPDLLKTHDLRRR